MLAEALSAPSGPIDRLERALARLPRYRLLAGETPIQELPRLSERLGRRIYVKRDDLTGLAFGGNKVRQAEFLIGEALARGADTVVGGGGFAQSNHARVLAAAARAAGLEPVILLRPGRGTAAVDRRGNALVTRILASDVRVEEALRRAPDGDRRAEVAYRQAIFDAAADELASRGRKPYVVYGSSTGLGVMGYVAAAAELHRQCRRLGLEFSKIFVTSLGATHAGLDLGSQLLGDRHELVGVAYQPAERPQAEATVAALASEAAGILGLTLPSEYRPRTDVAEAGARYGAATARSRRALQTAAQADGLMLDPTYTAKGFAGLLRWIAEGEVAEGESVLFVHTGGLPGLFARPPRELLETPAA